MTHRTGHIPAGGMLALSLALLGAARIVSGLNSVVFVKVFTFYLEIMPRR